MSVVNKMLQDLENRKKANSLGADYIPAQSTSKKWMVISFAIVLSVSVFVLVLMSTGQSEPTSIYTQQLPVTSVNDVYNVSPDVRLNQANVTAQEDIKDSAILSSEKDEALLRSEAHLSLAHPLELSKDKQPQASQATKPVITKDLSKEQAIVVELTRSSQNVQQAESQSDLNVAPSNGIEAALSSLREQARISLAQNNVSGAIITLEQLVTQFPEDTKARKQLASLLFSHNGTERAYSVLKQGLVITPSDNPMRIMLARVAFKKGDFEDAHSVLSEHPYPNLANIELLSFRAAIAERLSRYQTAYQDYQVLVRREPKNARWWLGLGVSQDKLELQQQALNSYQEAMALNQLPEQVNIFVEQRISALEGQS